MTAAAPYHVMLPIPTIGVIGRGYLAPTVSFSAEFSGLKLRREPGDVKFLDFDLYGTVHFARNVGVQGGYRSVVVDYLDRAETSRGFVDEDSANLKMKGPYFGAVVRF